VAVEGSVRLFADWLAPEAPFSDLPDLSCFAEVDGSRSTVEAALQAIVVGYLIGIDVLARLIGSRGALLAAEERVPKTPREMSADFGEILASAYVEECSDFRLPLRRHSDALASLSGRR
jgi:hypothetical protein